MDNGGQPGRASTTVDARPGCTPGYPHANPPVDNSLTCARRELSTVSTAPMKTTGYLSKTTKSNHQRWGSVDRLDSGASSTGAPGSGAHRRARASRRPPVRRAGSSVAEVSDACTDAEASHEVPGGARRARRRRGVDGQEPAQPPVGAGARRRAAAGHRRPAARSPASTTRSPARSPSRCRPTPTAPRWSPAGCSPRSPRRCRPSRSTSPRSAPTWSWSAAAPGSPCRPCRSRTTRPCRRCRASAGTVDAAAFAAAVAQVAIAAGRDETLPMMTGVRMELDGSTLALLATDRYRLAMREIEWRPDDPDDQPATRWCRPAPWPTPPRRSARSAARSPSRWPRAAPARA